MVVASLSSKGYKGKNTEVGDLYFSGLGFL